MKKRALLFTPLLLASILTSAPPATAELAKHPAPDAVCKGGWTMAQAPGTESTYDALYGVAMVSASDVWAVGASLTPGTHALIEHWDGAAWSIVETSIQHELLGVAAASFNDAWAVGTDTVVLHWDGTAWAEVPTPSPGPYGGVLDAVAIAGPDDVWAAGYAFGSQEGDSTVLIEHWDGVAWSIVPSPSPTGRDSLWALSVVSPSEIWAIGHMNSGGVWQSLVERWDGNAWVIAPAPPGTPQGALKDLVAFGSADVWAAGYKADIGYTQPVFQHWDGIAWSEVPGPEIRTYGQIFAVSGPSTKRLWAVGQQDRGALIERWDGSSWRTVPAPSPHGSLPAALYDVAWSGPGPAWTVGTTEINFGDPLVGRTCRG